MHKKFLISLGTWPLAPVDPPLRCQSQRLRLRFMDLGGRPTCVVNCHPLRCSEYLFACANASEPVSSTAYAERHLAVPLRDEKGVAVVVVDVNLGETETLAPAAFESRQIGHVMKQLAAANAEIIADSQDGRKVSCIGKSLLLVRSSRMRILRILIFFPKFTNFYSELWNFQRILNFRFLLFVNFLRLLQLVNGTSNQSDCLFKFHDVNRSTDVASLTQTRLHFANCVGVLVRTSSSHIYTMSV